MLIAFFCDEEVFVFHQQGAPLWFTMATNCYQYEHGGGNHEHSLSIGLSIAE
jgi:hypothetical protein